MKAFQQYWTFSAIRGAMTILASCFILALPLTTSSMLSLPVLVALAIDCLATYTIFDGAVMILLERLMPTRATNRRILYGQAGIALVLGTTFYLFGYGMLNQSWLLWIVAAQAAMAAGAEFLIARNTHQEYGCLSCYSTSMVLGLCAVFLPFANGLNATDTSYVLAAYVGLYGASELFLGGRMLFAEYRSEHPAAVASEAWKVAMLEPEAAPLLPLAARRICSNCVECPADSLCHDNSLSGQVGMVLAERRPAIVVSTRVVASLSKQPHPVAA
ncbi:hypothetical protein [Granulicella tundricola]|uniref:Uncharacterized protein n=1 Tax=Granulicella tundricola (strain ATCC BAA-1859 / DSM 23138 / MP5ACTX9) TaxID=1198114 RepID=E8X4N9_GRATM|nr:hypothetical protein [Granulicella tundricola]ADW69449.1 hypothetical protein AciX9_2412 [Granulicella tundricola MP5ACTX9]